MPTPPDAGDIPTGTGELVLVIDDEVEVRTTIRRVLERAGYRVMEVSGGHDAVTAIEEHPDIAMVITDMMMPGLDGPATIRALRRVRRDVVIIATSGVHDRGNPTGLAELGVEHFLSKPFNVATLLQTVDTALHGDTERPD